MPTAPMLNRVEKRKANAKKRYKRIKERINHLYTVERMRFDDVIQQVADEFGYSERTVKDIMKK